MNWNSLKDNQGKAAPNSLLLSWLKIRNPLKELKIECTYESEENRKKAIKLRAHLTHFRDILVDILMQQDRMSTNPN